MIKTAKERLMEQIQIDESECEAGCFVSLLSTYKDEEIRELREDLENCKEKLQEANEKISMLEEKVSLKEEKIDLSEKKVWMTSDDCPKAIVPRIILNPWGDPV